MKTLRSTHLCGLIAASVLALAAGNGSLSAQENIVALGRVSETGVLLSSENTVSGLITPVRTGVGAYTVTVTAAGAFTGAVVNDFVVLSSIASTLSGDDTIKATVTTVTANAVTFTVNVDDVENSATSNDQISADSPFFFTLYREPTVFPATTKPQYLLGSGVVDSSGVLSGGVGIEGLTMTSVQNAPGDYQVTLANPGEFVGDLPTDYVLNLTIRGAGTSDLVIRGEVSDVTGNGEVVFNIHTDDAQAVIGANEPVPASSSFYFTVLRIPGAVQTEAGPSLVNALVWVDANGNLLTAPTSFDGGSIVSVRNSVGDYRVTIVSAGAFADRAAYDFVVQANLNQSAPSDEGIVADVTVADANTLHIDVNINDLQLNAQSAGFATDAAFSLVIMDSAEAADNAVAVRAQVRPDLKIGRSRNLTKMRGNDIYNRTTQRQRVNVPLVKQQWSKYHFALENDGDRPDRVKLRGTRSNRSISTKYFSIGGNRKNITGQMTRGGKIEAPINPGQILRYQGWVKYTASNRRNDDVKIVARSLVDRARVDAVRANVRSKD